MYGKVKKWNSCPFLCEDLKHFVSFAAMPSSSAVVLILAVFSLLLGWKNCMWIDMGEKKLWRTLHLSTDECKYASGTGLTIQKSRKEPPAKPLALGVKLVGVFGSSAVVTSPYMTVHTNKPTFTSSFPVFSPFVLENTDFNQTTCSKTSYSTTTNNERAPNNKGGYPYMRAWQVKVRKAALFLQGHTDQLLGLLGRKGNVCLFETHLRTQPAGGTTAEHLPICMCLCL